MLTDVVIVGQGYVGLPLSMGAASAGFKVTGVDIDIFKVNQLKSSFSTVEDVTNEEINTFLMEKKYNVTSDFQVVSDAKIIVICVPTPLNEDRSPNLNLLERAVKSVAEFLQSDTLVIVESTIAPGTTRNLVLPLLQKFSGLSQEEFYLGFSPERIDPGNNNWNLYNTPKIVSGLTNEARIKTKKFYSKFIKSIVECDSLEVAEMSKLLENTFRFVNISFINELNMLCEKLGIDTNEVIKAASTKPYGFMPFYPSLGIGGHCIPVDPLYLAHKAKEVGSTSKFISLSEEINLNMPNYYVSLAKRKLTSLNHKKIIVIGVSYKSNISDVRETPVERLILGLKKHGAIVNWHDDLVKEWNGEKSVALSSDFDLAILATPHDYIDLTKLGEVPILNTRGSI